MAVQGGFQGNADWCLWQCWDCLTLELSLWALGWWLAVAVAGVVKLGEACLGQLMRTSCDGYA
jgi:hypothetical protein